MKIKYCGPRDKIEVGPYGRHFLDEVKEYPADFGLELLLSSKKQLFEPVGKLSKKAEAALKAKAEGEKPPEDDAEKEDLKETGEGTPGDGGGSEGDPGDEEAGEGTPGDGGGSEGDPGEEETDSEEEEEQP